MAAPPHRDRAGSFPASSAMSELTPGSTSFSKSFLFGTPSSFFLGPPRTERGPLIEKNPVLSSMLQRLCITDESPELVERVWSWQVSCFFFLQGQIPFTSPFPIGHTKNSSQFSFFPGVFCFFFIAFSYFVGGALYRPFLRSCQDRPVLPGPFSGPVILVFNPPCAWHR